MGDKITKEKRVKEENPREQLSCPSSGANGQIRIGVRMTGSGGGYKWLF